jgi:hypothetical protein
MAEDDDIITEMVKALLGSITTGGTSYLMGWYTPLGLESLPDPMPWAFAALGGCVFAFTIRPKTIPARKVTFRWNVVVFLLFLLLYVAYKEVNRFIPWLAVVALIDTMCLFCSLTLLLGLAPGEYKRWKNLHH